MQHEGDRTNDVEIELAEPAMVELIRQIMSASVMAEARFVEKQIS